MTIFPHLRPLWPLLPFFLLSCGQQNEQSADATQAALNPPPLAGEYIIGTVDWREITSFDAASIVRQNSKRVGDFRIPAVGSRCTASLISADVIITNHHCVSSQADTEGAYVYFKHEAGVSSSNWDKVACNQFILADEDLDYALVRCTGSPGLTRGFSALNASAYMASGSQIYMIHQNCDYFSVTGCDPSKKYSPGVINSRSGYNYYHSADSLGGSSGSPVFSATSNQLIALHHIGIGDSSTGRGQYNGAVPIYDIIQDLRVRNPQVLLDSNASQTTATGPQYSRFPITLPYLSQAGAISAVNEVDVFSFRVTTAKTLSVILKYAYSSTKDLDLVVYQVDSTGKMIKKVGASTDPDSLDDLYVYVGVGYYQVLVYGYEKAINSYTLTIK